MAYLKPPWFTVRIFNRIAMATGIAGTETLTLTGRSSGRLQRIPVIAVEVDGNRYLVSTRGESDWVKNVRVDPAVSLGGRGTGARFTAAEVPLGDRPPILRAYRDKAGKTVEGYFASLPDAADHPVFKLIPV